MYDTIKKTIAAWAFNHYIAYYYFENVNVSQLKVAFEKGEVELENLPIKKEALQHFKLSMDVISGVVGKLSIKVPLLTLLTEPWVIKITNLMLIVAPKGHSNDATNTTTSNHDSNASSNDDRNTSITNPDYTQLDLLQEANEANLTDYLENSTLDEDFPTSINSEETKLAEFYSSFSSTVSNVVRDIYKNIKLEIESTTILFEDFDHGLAKFEVDKLLLHRPKSARNLRMENISIYLESIGFPSRDEQNDLLRLNIRSCNLDIEDEASNNMQLVVVQQDNSTSKQNAPNNYTPNSNKIRVEGILDGVSIRQMFTDNRRSSEKIHKSSTSSKNERDDSFIYKRQILDCDTIKLDFKISNLSAEEIIRSAEKNLHIKLDLVGMQYTHSQGIYDITTQRLMNLLKFILKLHSKQRNDISSKSSGQKLADSPSKSFKRHDDTNINKLLVINIEDGLLFIVDDTSGSCCIPLLEFSLEDCRILQFSGKHQHNGFIFAKVGCSYYNREFSSWETLLRPWPFNLSWDLKAENVTGGKNRKVQHREISLNSDEFAEFAFSNALLDLSDISLKRVIDSVIHPKLWPIKTIINPNRMELARDSNSIFLIHNETGYRLHFAPLEVDYDILEIGEQSKSVSPVSFFGGDTLAQNTSSKPSTTRSSTCSRDSPDLSLLARWILVEAGETKPFEFETQPIYRRHLSDSNERFRSLLIRVEGWKTLLPISIDKTGLFFREASSDRVTNEDTHIAVSIDLEEGSARKIISIRSPIYLANLLDATLEVHFVESNQALYIKPDGHLAVPLPYLFNKMHIRPCNVGVTMSEKCLIWDDIRNVCDFYSEIHTCQPITVTNSKHASYSTSQPYRICTAIQKDKQTEDIYELDQAIYDESSQVYSIAFLPPVIIVNHLPCKIHFYLAQLNGSLSAGCRQKVCNIDISQPLELQFKITGLPKSEVITIDPEIVGSDETKISFFSDNDDDNETDTDVNNDPFIDISLRRYAKYSKTMIVTFKTRYGFDPLTKMPRRPPESSPHNYKLTSYNHNANLAERIAGRAVSLFDNYTHKITSNVNLILPGFRVALIDNKGDKFIEASVENIVVKCVTKHKEQILDCCVQDIRITNALDDCEKDIILDRANSTTDNTNEEPAIHLIMDRILGRSMGTTLFRQVQLSMCELVLNIEEKLVLKLVEFMNFRSRHRRKNISNLSHEPDRYLHSKRLSMYYFDLLRIDLSGLKLSVFTSANLSNALMKLKSRLGLKFFAFEDAQVQLNPYFKMNVSRTFRGVFDSVTRFYKRQFFEQAPRIVGQQIQNYLRYHLSDLLSSLYDGVYNKLFFQDIIL